VLYDFCRYIMHIGVCIIILDIFNSFLELTFRIPFSLFSLVVLNILEFLQFNRCVFLLLSIASLIYFLSLLLNYSIYFSTLYFFFNFLVPRLTFYICWKSDIDQKTRLIHNI